MLGPEEVVSQGRDLWTVTRRKIYIFIRSTGYTKIRWFTGVRWNTIWAKTVRNRQHVKIRAGKLRWERHWALRGTCTGEVKIKEKAESSKTDYRIVIETSEVIHNIITDHSKTAWSVTHRHTTACARWIQQKHTQYTSPECSTTWTNEPINDQGAYIQLRGAYSHFTQPDWHYTTISLDTQWYHTAEEFALGIDPKSLHATVLMQMVYNAVVRHSGRFLKRVAISVTWKGKNKGGGVDWFITNAVTMT